MAFVPSMAARNLSSVIWLMMRNQPALPGGTASPICSRTCLLDAGLAHLAEERAHAGADRHAEERHEEEQAEEHAPERAAHGARADQAARRCLTCGLPSASRTTSAASLSCTIMSFCSSASLRPNLSASISFSKPRTIISLIDPPRRFTLSVWCVAYLTSAGSGLPALRQPRMTVSLPCWSGRDILPTSPEGGRARNGAATQDAPLSERAIQVHRRRTRRSQEHDRRELHPRTSRSASSPSAGSATSPCATSPPRPASRTRSSTTTGGPRSDLLRGDDRAQPDGGCAPGWRSAAPSSAAVMRRRRDLAPEPPVRAVTHPCAPRRHVAVRVAGRVPRHRDCIGAPARRDSRRRHRRDATCACASHAWSPCWRAGCSSRTSCSRWSGCPPTTANADARSSWRPSAGC